MSGDFIHYGSHHNALVREEIEQSISDRFESVARKFPNKLAISTHLEKYSYASLNQSANRVARAMLLHCHDNEAPIAILLDQGAAQIVTTLGVLKAGKFYLPLDPSNPLPRNKHMFDDSAARIIITNNKNMAVADGLSSQKHFILNIDETGNDASGDDLGLAISPDSLSYILYTSGSTGNPKGVVQNHRNVLHNVMRHTDAYSICPDDKQTLLYTSSVYGGQRDMFNALLNGASLHVYVVKNEGIQGLADWLIKNQITLYCSVATIFRQFIETLSGSERFDSLRLIKLGGEATYKREVDSYKEHFSSSCIMHCGLGSTETGLVRNYFINKSTLITGNTVPLGYPINDLEIQLLDDEGKPITSGNTGEIAIKSRYIALGYWRNPELTQKVFISDPEDDSIRIYRTGDIGLIHPDGCLEHRGRKDFQIKIRGNRVEVAEIEMALLRLDAIKEAVIVGWKDPHGMDKLVAYLVASGNTIPGTRELQASIRSILPEFMVPSYFVWLTSLPLMPNGKLDRQSLPKPGIEKISLAQAYIEPTTPIEKKLVEIWSTLLEVARVGIYDNFFELGGDSLTAVILFSCLDKEFGINLPTSTLVDHPTIHSLAMVLGDRDYHIEWPVIVPVKRTGSRSPFFCVHGIFGDQFFLRSLGAHLCENQPLYALQSKRLDGKFFAYKTVGEIATSYLKEICAIQPSGPYFIGGYSFGGNVALEMARQLTDSGEVVDLLAVFDSSPPDLTNIKPKGWLKRMISIPTDILDFSAKAMVSRKKLGVLTRLRVMANALNSAKKYIGNQFLHASLKLGFTLPVMMRDEYIAWNHYRISCAYNPAPYPGDIAVFYTAKKEARILSGWGKATTGKLSTYPLPGEHDNFFKEPNVLVLAQQLNKLLDTSFTSGGT